MVEPLAGTRQTVLLSCGFTTRAEAARDTWASDVVRGDDERLGVRRSTGENTRIGVVVDGDDAEG